MFHHRVTPELEHIAVFEQLDRFGDQAGAIASVRQLSEAVDQLAARQRETADAAQRVATAYAEQRAAADQARGTQANLRAEVDHVAGNAVVDVDSTGNYSLNKRKSRSKIDGIVAMIMALDRAVRAALPADAIIRAAADDLGPSHVTLEDGRRIEAGAVLDVCATNLAHALEDLVRDGPPPFP